MHGPAESVPAPAAPVIVVDAGAMREFGRSLAAQLRPGDLVLLCGPLGAGKTTLAQGLGDGLGVRGPVTSPTFVIARIHPSLGDGPALVHVDAYRLRPGAEIDDLDLDASLEDSVTVVEWGEGKVEGLAPDRLEVTIERLDPGAGDDGGAAAAAGGAGNAGDAGDGAGPDVRAVRIRGVGDRWAAGSGRLS